MIKLILVPILFVCINIILYYALGVQLVCRVIVPVGTPLLVVVLGLLVYFEQKKSERLFKLYFEDTFLAIIKDLDEGMRRCNHAFLVFEKFENIILNLIKQKEVTCEYFLRTLYDLKTQIPEHVKFHDAPRFRLEELGFEEYLINWIGIADADFHRFLENVDGQIGILINNFSVHSVQRDAERDIEMLKTIGNHLQRYYILVERHYALIESLSRIIRSYTESNFISRKTLLRLLKSRKFRKINDVVSEVFHCLFIYYKTENKDVTYTYARDDSGRNFKIEKKGTGYIVSSEKFDETMSFGKMKIRNDEKLIDAKVYGNPDFNLHKELIGIGNMVLYKKPPRLPETNY